MYLLKSLTTAKGNHIHAMENTRNKLHYKNMYL